MIFKKGDFQIYLVIFKSVVKYLSSLYYLDYHMTKTLVLSRQKLCRTNLTRKNLFKAIVMEGGTIFHLCLLIALLKRKRNFLVSLWMEVILEGIKAPTEVRLLPSHRDCEIGWHLPWLHFKGMVQKSLRKTVLVVKVPRDFLKVLNFWEEEKNFAITSFLK